MAGLAKLLRNLAMLMVLSIVGHVAGCKGQHDCSCMQQVRAGSRQENAACDYRVCRKSERELKEKGREVESCHESHEHDKNGC